MNLKQLRNKKGWSQTELSSASGYSIRTIQRYESGGNIRPAVVDLLKKVLKVK